MRVTRRNAMCLPLVAACLSLAGLSFAASGAAAQTAAPDTIKIGLVIPMTGVQGAVGREISDAAKLYMAQHGDTVAGKKIELIVRDDQSVPDNAKRLTQELIVNDKVGFLGAGLTPSAMSMAPLATEAKIPTVVMVSGTSVVTERSPYYVRTSFTLGQQSGIIADWAIKNGSKKAVAVLSDWAPGAEAGKVFTDHFTKGGGEVLDTLKVPLANPDFSPFLQRARDLSGRPSRHFRAAIRRARPRQIRHQADRARRHRRRRRSAVDRRCAPWRHHGRNLFGDTSVATQQGLCRGLSEGERPPCQFYFSRRLRRHASDL
jgi:hypothetical protein